MLVRQDLHIHTYLSPCANATATAAHYVEKAKALHLDTIAITDHMWDPKISIAYGDAEWYHSYHLTPEHIARARADAEAVPHEGLRILFGCETEYDRIRRRPAIHPETAARMEVLLAPNSHTHCTMPKELYEPYSRHADYLVQAFMDIVTSDVADYITAIPHPFLAVGCPYDNRLLFPEIGEKRFSECFQAAAEAGIAMEINTSSLSAHYKDAPELMTAVRNDPTMEMFRLAKKAGCKFTFGSDSHDEKHHDTFPAAVIAAEYLGLTEADILYL